MMTGHLFDKTDLLSYVTGATDAGRRGAIEAHLASCAECRRYCGAMASEKRAFLAAHPFEATVTLPRSIEPPRRRQLFFQRREYYALAASIVLFFSAGIFFMAGRDDQGIRIKGSVGLKAFVRNHRGDIEKRGENRYFTGERIQFLYSCESENRFLLLGIDTAGTITTYYPAGADSSCELERGQDIPLPHSIVLDDYTGGELFLAVFSKQPLSVSEVRSRLAASFSATRSLDSVSIGRDDVTAVRYFCTVDREGDR